MPLALGFGVNVVAPTEPNPGDPHPIPVTPVPCPTAPPIVLQEVKITGLPPCAKAVYNGLSTMTDGMRDILSTFNSPASFGFNWTLESGTLGAGINGTTIDNSITNTATTTFDLNKYTNSTDLALARTMLHEAAHAYLKRFFDMRRLDANREYKDLVDIYISDYIGDELGAHHEAFVNNFINRIALSLQEYGDSKGYTFASYYEKSQFYQYMAWGGLDGTKAFNSLSPSMQSAIRNTILLEQYNTNLPGFNAVQKGTKLKC